MAIKLKINGKNYTVPTGQYPVDTTLNTFLRDHAQLPGTKFMCLEGGCGVCVCVLKKVHPVSKEMQVMAVNSCLVLLNTCDDSEVVTIEGIGNKKDGYHPIQKRLAEFNGTQCGYCSPGMVMNMYGLLESKKGSVTMEDVENSFGGNICRCTGYRPILDAMKSFATDSIYPCKKASSCQSDIEDLGEMFKKASSSDAKGSKGEVLCKNGQLWYSPQSVKEITEILSNIGDKTYTFVAGNTAHGVYRRQVDFEIFIDLTKALELHDHKVEKGVLSIGANGTLGETMDIFSGSKTQSGFEYLGVLHDHLDLIANVPVRNMGTLAGNLSIKHEHNEFVSDVFVILNTIGAKLLIAAADGTTSLVSVIDYLQLDMNKKVIVSIQFPPLLASKFKLKTYKIMPRAQNAHAYVNAGFLLEFGEDDKIVSSRICFGGIRPDFNRATKAEEFLRGKSLSDEKLVQDLLKLIEQDTDSHWVLPGPSPEYRKILACGLFYKFVLSILPETVVKEEYRSGGELLKRNLSSGRQFFKTDKSRYPLTEAVPKFEGMIQCSGEAFYVNDIPKQPYELYAAFVCAKVVGANIAKLDPTEALKMTGVHAFFSAKDIPGKNSFVSTTMFAFLEEEEIFCSKEVKFFGQPVGIVVAESTPLAQKAAEKVEIIYENMEGRKVCSTLEDVIVDRSSKKILNICSIDPPKEQTNALEAGKKFKGHLSIGSQYHFTTEPQTAICMPKDNGMEIYASSQWTDLLQVTVAAALKIPENAIFVQVPRIGGGFGAKISRCCQIACACALACSKLNVPVRFVQGLESMMLSLGKRFACFSEYEVEVDDSGKILNLENTFFEDCGSTRNESPVEVLSVPSFKICYESSSNWKISANVVKTDSPSHTWCRAPGTVEGFAMIETIMEHIARVTNKDPMEVRVRNLKNTDDIRQLFKEFISSVEYKSRREDIQSYNKQNRWTKRGIGISIMQYPIHFFGAYPATVAIYHGDGSVLISHGGIEMGQGINTKLIQVAAYTLGLPMSMINIRPNDSFNSANSNVSSASISSESLGFAVKKACQTLNDRIKPVRDEMKNAPWGEVIQKCYERNVHLMACETYKAGDLKPYNVWGISCSEVQVDVLTGNLIINRVDLQEDTGESLSPLIDVGQIEGAFMMGVGYWLTEKLVHDRQTGELLTTRTWNYKPPGAKDVPVDFRITLLQNKSNPVGFLRSKTTGEPAACLSVSVVFALRHALDSARKDAGLADQWYHLGAPTTPEDIVLAAGNSIANMKLK